MVEDKEKQNKDVRKEDKTDKKDIVIKQNSFDKGKIIEKVRGNPWFVSTFVLGVIVIVMLLTNFSFGITGNVSKDTASANLMKFLSENIPDTVTILDISKEDGFYKVNVDYQGNTVPLYVTLDGKYMASLQPITSETSSSGTTPTANVPKSDKPAVELFIMTECPYGTQAEKGIIPVIKEIGSKADIKIRFVHYFMHGEKEETETYTQLCIREEQASDFIDYLSCYLEDGNSERCVTKVGIDKAKLDSCVKNNAKKYYEEDSKLSNQYGVSGSPTLVINGQQANSGRSPSAFLATICSAFNNAPSGCSKELSTTNPSAGFGYSEGSATDAQC